MLEYVFFDPRPRDRFVAFVSQLGVQARLQTDDDLLQVLLDEDLPEELDRQVEEFYDQMMALNQALYEQEGERGEVGYHTAGITVQLGNGDNVYAQVDPELLARILQAVTPDEFNQVVHAIVSAVGDPDSRSLCQRMRDEEKGG